MNCKYCSVLFDTYKYNVPVKPTYSFNQLESFISNLQKTMHDNVADIYFFGGEPTTDYPCINELIKAFNKPLDYKVNYIMHTNGLLIPKAPREILEQVHITLLSINYELIFENYHIAPYFKNIIDAIDCLKFSNSNPIIGRITVSPKTSLFTECCLICNFVDYIYWQIDNCLSAKDYEEYYKHYSYEITLLYKYWFECFSKGIFLRFVPFISAIRFLINDTDIPAKYYCGYGSSMVYVQTNGDCFACCDNIATKSHYLGNIFSGIQFPKIDLKDTICSNCSYIKLCGGRCGRMHKDFSNERKRQYCKLNKFMFDLIIADIEKIKLIIKSNSSFYDKIMDPLISYTEFTS